MSEILYRFFGRYDGRVVSLCQHLRAELDEYLEWTIEADEMLKVKKAEADGCGGLDTIMPMDLTEEERFRFAEQATKYFFWGRGTRKCEACGHIARGRLAQSTAEEKERWRREQDETEEELPLH